MRHELTPEVTPSPGGLPLAPTPAAVNIDPSEPPAKALLVNWDATHHDSLRHSDSSSTPSCFSPKQLYVITGLITIAFVAYTLLMEGLLNRRPAAAAAAGTSLSSSANS
jgi:hypothetical protein